MNEFDDLIEKAIGLTEEDTIGGHSLQDYEDDGGTFDAHDLRAVALAAYKKGCEDTAKDVSDAELVAQMFKRGHIRITLDGIAEEE